MLRSWPLLFIVIPIVELYFIIKVGEYIGAFWTVILVLGTAVIGVNLLRYQGVSTLTRAQRSMSRGEIPAMEMMEGMALAVGGAFLITPGFITDTLGFLCLVPYTRRAIIRYLMTHANVRTGGSGFYGSGFDAGRGAPDDGFIDGFQPGRPRPEKKPGKSSRTGRIIEGECRRED